MKRALVLCIVASACGGATDRGAPQPKEQSDPPAAPEEDAPTPKTELPSVEALQPEVQTSKPADPSKRTISFPKPGSSDTSPGTVQLGAAKVPETLDADEVRKALRRRVGYARMCYVAALAEEPGLKGKIVLRLTVDAKGGVEEVGFPSHTMSSVAVEDCLERGVKGLKFSAPTKAPAMVDVPLTFSPE